MDRARRELHAVDRMDWPPLSVNYGLPWEQFFHKREADLFGVVRTPCALAHIKCAWISSQPVVARPHNVCCS